MFLVNGNQQQSVPIGDRSFQYGDGCFTTVLVQFGQPLLLDEHRQRIDLACKRLFITPPDWDLVKQWIHAAINDSGNVFQPLSGLKIHVSRGTGGRGYSPASVCEARVTIQTFDYPAHYSTWQSKGIKVGISTTCLGINPLLAGLKHNNRLEQVLIKKEIDDSPVDDNIVLDIQAHVVEMCASNLFWIIDHELYTPMLSNNGVIGIKRTQLLAYAEQYGIHVHIRQFTLNDVLNADEVFITNAIHGVVPIIQIDNKKFHIGAITRAIQEKLNP